MYINILHILKLTSENNVIIMSLQTLILMQKNNILSKILFLNQKYNRELSFPSAEFNIPKVARDYHFSEPCKQLFLKYALLKAKFEKLI